MPEQDDSKAISNDYFNTAIVRFMLVKENGHNNPRGFKYIIDAHNNEDPNRTKKFIVSIVLQDWGTQTI